MPRNRLPEVHRRSSSLRNPSNMDWAKQLDPKTATAWILYAINAMPIFPSVNATIQLVAASKVSKSQSADPPQEAIANSSKAPG